MESKANSTGLSFVDHFCAATRRGHGLDHVAQAKRAWLTAEECKGHALFFSDSSHRGQQYHLLGSELLVSILRIMPSRSHEPASDLAGIPSSSPRNQAQPQQRYSLGIPTHEPVVVSVGVVLARS